jgi:hypothetical protein
MATAALSVVVPLISVIADVTSHTPGVRVMLACV